ncbi:MAG: 1-acyl-sn-glycerol-3-phosphate acyltransferase [Deltaproteobacteria bacterium]|nr:1-acyl-sn-glycerol-3-phosphate acyltransferase [Deltaproteobacteria bacterium]
MIPKDRHIALTETTSRALEWCREQSKTPGKLSIEEIINETLYHERFRLRGHVHAPHKDQDKAYWRKIARTFPNAGAAQQIEILQQIIHRYGDEIIGHFSPLFFKALTRYGSKTLSVLLNSMSPIRLASAVASLESLDDNITVLGAVDALKSLSQKGTVILAPTHVSNLDSVVLGYALARIGLPPFLYGAGYNLFKNPIFAPFLKRLGAYTVDRQKKAPLYKHVLKTYATVSMEMGYHQIFFPGGTRSRSGRVESRLKKGLLGCGLEAYEMNLRRHKQRPNVYIVPCTLTYQMVLEAETLVADYLAEAGKARYIIEDDESSRVDRMVHFLRTVLRHQSSIHMHIGAAMDPFGNRVLDDGTSVDQHGRPITIDGYLKQRGVFVHDQQRNEEFTSQVSDKLTERYPQGTVVGPTHVVAHVLFNMLLAESAGTDLYRVLREGQIHTGFLIDSVRTEIGAALDALRTLAADKRLHLDAVALSADVDDVLSRALVCFTVYHAEPAVERRGNRVFVLNRALLYYYRNRLQGFPLPHAATIVGTDKAPAETNAHA